MPLREQQNLLTRLYTDAAIRASFFAEPARVGPEFGLEESESLELAAVSRQELDFFADSLVAKRRREVERLIPSTVGPLGGDFQELFTEFAARFVPHGHLKHLEDAIAFCDWLRGRPVRKDVHSAAAFDSARLDFHGFRRRFRVCVGAGNGAENSRPKAAVWLRTGRGHRFFTVPLPRFLFRT